MFQVNEALRQRAGLKAKMLALAGPDLNKHLSETEQKEFDGLSSELKNLNQKLDEHARLSYAPGQAPPNAGRKYTDPDLSPPMIFGPGNNGEKTKGRSGYEMPEEFAQFLRYGDKSALANLSPTGDGAVMIPTVLYDSVTRLHVGYRPVESVARVIPTENGDPLKFPRIDDTETGEYLAASASTGSSTPPTSLDSITLGAWKASSKPVSVSRELLTDAQYDVGAEIIAVLINRTGRLLNRDYTKGDGSSKPSGFLHGCTVVGAQGSTAEAG